MMVRVPACVGGPALSCCWLVPPTPCIGSRRHHGLTLSRVCVSAASALWQVSDSIYNDNQSTERGAGAGQGTSERMMLSANQPRTSETLAHIHCVSEW